MTLRDGILKSLQGYLVDNLVSNYSGTNLTAQAEVNNFVKRRTVRFGFADATAANAVGEWEVFRADVPITVISAYLCVGKAVTASDTVYATCTLAKRTVIDPTTAVTVADCNTGVTAPAHFTGSLVAFTPVALTLSATAAAVNLAIGDTLTFKVDKASTGTALGAAATAAGQTVLISVVYEEA